MLRTLSLLVVAAASCSASADLVVFRNDGFTWNALRQGMLCPGSTTGTHLDVTLPASQDGNTPTSSSFWYDRCVGLTRGARSRGGAPCSAPC